MATEAELMKILERGDELTRAGKITQALKAYSQVWEASKADPFALHRGLGRLAQSLLLDSKLGRPKRLAELLVSFLPPRAKRPREVAALPKRSAFPVGM